MENEILSLDKATHSMRQLTVHSEHSNSQGSIHSPQDEMASYYSN